MSAILEIKNLQVDIPSAAGIFHPVQDVSFTLNEGETIGIVGESGCGKSLTALSIMGLLPKKAQRMANQMSFRDIDLLGKNRQEMSDVLGSRISMIFQEPMTSLNPSFTIGNQLTEILLRHQKVSKRLAQERAVFLLEKVGITMAADRLRQYPYQLSGGLRQRVMIAMMLMCGPELIIADEPTTALDVTIQAQILYLLADLQREFGMAMMLITHDLGVVARIADKVAVMYAGQIVETGPAKEIFKNPVHPYTQGLLSCIPTPGKTRRGDHLGSIQGSVPALIGEMKGCHFKNRCNYVHQQCNESSIRLHQIGNEHSYRCLLPLDVCRENAVNKQGV